MRTMSDPDLGPEDYLLYEVIRKSHQIRDDLPKTEFHKLSFLVYKDLADSGVDVNLPVYWYEHGIMVDTDNMGDFFGTERANWKSHSGRRVVIDDDLSIRDFDVSDGLRKLIDRTVTKYVRKFQRTYDTTAVKDETYEEFADNQFIKHLNNFRYYLDELEDDSAVKADSYAPTEVSFEEIVGTDQFESEQSVDEEKIEKVLDYLDQMVATYPHEKYDRMYETFLQWESITRQFAYNGMLSQLGNFTDAFWNTFSRVELRIHHNENVSNLKVTRWKRKRQENIEDFEEIIDRYRKTLLKNRDSTNALDEVSGEYGEAIEEMYNDLSGR